MECVLPEIDTDCDNVRLGLRSCCCRAGSTLPLRAGVVHANNT